MFALDFGKHYVMLTVVFFFLSTGISNSQIETIYSQYRTSLNQDSCLISDLQYLCDHYGGRVTGSNANLASVDWARDIFNAAGIQADKDAFRMPTLWLGGTTKMQITGKNTVDFSPQAVSKYKTQSGKFSGELVSVGEGDSLSFAENATKIKNAFILVETDLCLDINGLFAEYKHATEVELLAEQYKAAGIIFMASRPKGLLYRFISSKTTELSRPQFVMVREDAKRCMRLLEDAEKLDIRITTQHQEGDAFESYNVIAEIPGSDLADEVIVIGAHLDSWALGTGANDNGCNVAMMLSLARQMKVLAIQPRRTIRFALWNGEEQGYFGSLAYVQQNSTSLDDHRLAISIDIGSGEITGFFTNGRKDLYDIVDNITQRMQDSLVHLNIPIVGTDNYDFMMEGIPNLVGIHKPQLYGINYHASSDTFDKVDTTQLKKNSGMIGEFILRYANQDSIDLPRLTRKEIQQRVIDDHDLDFTLQMFNVWESWKNRERGRVD